MRVVIMGCGRVGAALATELDVDGHDVVVIDRESSAFTRLPEDFGGRTVTGLGFDRAVLEAAGLDGADAFAAVSSGDNSNIIAARVARETFGVERVIARIYDAGRAAVYERLGIPTVATVPWATGHLVRYITEGSSPVVWRDKSGEVALVALVAPAVWVGTAVDDLAAVAGGRVAAITRFGECRVPDARTLVQAEDLLHLAVPAGAVEGLDDTLERGPADD
ncbi:TrkA family potassium uptake protein [Rhodococcus sp. IEGM 1408]|uniref:potassium channel family protein n=1 Tax=Rhodococcus sp. IEGM 1408 TaxID=3082220 RepID=UPI002955135D|nr:TrkA family potassium uptake protein [Rhodococcus sp. IEGM 1408]MDV8000368.1 TrkA family potassium uptake protein [Rhodococcus sp. IEGM 1408]